MRITSAFCLLISARFSKGVLSFAALAMQLDKHTVGYLTYRAGIQSAMSTMIVRDTSRSYTALSIHFGILQSFASLNYTYKMEEKQMKLRGSVKLVASNELLCNS